jgi:HK97 family phage prohead protease
VTAQFLAALQTKTVTDSGAGEIEGLASTYGNVDLQDDVMEPGAMNKTVADWQRSKSRLPLLDWHGDSLSKLIGSVRHMKSVPQGLWFRAGFGSDPESQRARQLVKDGHLSGVSIGYLPIRHSWKQVDGRSVRSLQEVRLLEISLTPVPANPEAVLTSVKSFGDSGWYDDRDDLAELEALEAWAAREQNAAMIGAMLDNPDSMSAAMNVLAQSKASQDLAELEAWAAAQPPAPSNQDRARQRDEACRAQANAYSYALKASMARITPCGHRSCMPGRCVYR